MARPEVTGRKMAMARQDPPGAVHARDGPTDDADAYTIEEFCRKNRISVQLFYKYPHLMPDTFYVGKRRLVSREAGARWRAEREAAAA